MSNTTTTPPPAAASAFETKPRQQEENKTAAVQVNPASEEAQELRETGMRPVSVDEAANRHESASEKQTTEGAPGDEKIVTPPAERPPAEAAKQQEEGETKIENDENKPKDQVGSGEEVAGLTQLAAERASAAAAAAKEAAIAAAASAATATKETARKYGAAAVIDAERMYAVGKERVAGWVQGSQDAVKGAAQNVSAKSGEVLKSVGDKLVAAGTPPPPPPAEEQQEEPQKAP